ncbi:hypothetical protein HSE3_gp009 [Klebsiella phage vB_KleS-HSE3]|nr:hypothetical protein HSE3_gp009 [Klebsiella phage vB_KleS-HSE3]
MTTKKKKTADVTDRFTPGDILRFSYEVSEGGQPLRGSNIPGRGSLVEFITYSEINGVETIIARWICMDESGESYMPNVIEFPTNFFTHHGVADESALTAANIATVNHDLARDGETAAYLNAGNRHEEVAPDSAQEALDAVQVLDKVKGHLEARGRRYGEENGKERQFDRVADAFNIVRSSANRQNMPLTGLDVVTLQAILKICRAQTDEDTDSFEDLAGYAAIGAEIVGGMK